MAGMNLSYTKSRLWAMLSCNSAFWFLHTRRISLGLGPWPLAPPTSPLSTYHSELTSLSRQSCCSEPLLVVFRTEQRGHLLSQCAYLGTSRGTVLLLGSRFLLSRFVAAAACCTHRCMRAGTHSPMTRDLTAAPPSNRVQGACFLWAWNACRKGRSVWQRAPGWREDCLDCSLSTRSVPLA